MVENGAFHDGKAKTHSAWFGRAKRRKDFLSDFRRDAGAIVPHRYHDRSRLLSFAHWFGRKSDPRFVPVRACFGRIGYQMRKRFRERCLVSQDRRQIAWKRRFEFHFSINAKTRARDFNAFFDRRPNVNRLEHEFWRVREIVDLGDDFIEPIDLAYYDLIKFFAKIGIVETLRQ